MPIFTTTITGSSYTSSISNAVGFVGTASSAVSASFVSPSGLPSGVVSSSGQINGASITNNSVSYTAGNGLTGGGSATLGGSSVTINVGAGAGMTVNADDIAINTGSTHFISGARASISVTDTAGANGIDLTYNSGTGVLSGVLVTSTFNVGAGSGLTGGGSANLGATSTVNVGAGLGITVNVDDIAVDTSSAHFTNGVKSKLNTDGVISSSTQFTSLTAPFTGSFTGSFRGTLTGTGSWASSASVAISSSFATSASWAPTAASTVGPGTVNSIALFNASSTVSSSNIFQSTGNIGIGTTSPDANLTVQGQASFNSGTLANPGIAARGDLNTGIYFPTADTIGFVEGGVEAIRINSSGDVGIGTTTVDSRLHVSQSVESDANGAGTLRLTSTNGNLRLGNSATYSWIQSHNSRPLYINELGNNVIMNSGGGNVGIGTTNPTNKLHVQGNVSASSYTSSISNAVGFLGTASWAVSASRASSSNGVDVLSGGSTSAIGTYSGSFSGSFFGNTLSGGTANYIPLWTGASVQSSSIIYQSSGNIGVGTLSPSVKFEVSGSQRITSGSLGVNVAPNATVGRIDASNDIVAYSSDNRLKTNIQPISEPLNKIQNLSGFTYTWNNLAQRIAGFSTESKLVGVYAQEVQSVLPEAVKLAPFDNDGTDTSISGENYLTVQYEKIVPLLIEAIKELKAEVDELKRKI